METLHYHPVHRITASQILESAAKDVSYKFFYQVISTFQASFSIVLAFQTNDVIKKFIELQPIEVSYVYIIAILVMMTILSSYLKDKYVQFYGEFIKTSAGLPHSSHHFFQK